VVSYFKGRKSLRILENRALKKKFAFMQEEETEDWT
jgi:hypothetical protein